MSLQSELQSQIEKIVFKYIETVALKFNLNKAELMKLWNGERKEKNESVETSNFAVNTTLSIERIPKSTVAELKAFCKANNLKCSGKKDELISRLLDKLNGTAKKSLEVPKTINKTGVKEQKEKMIAEVAKKIASSNEQNIALRKNKFGNYEHPSTHLVFSVETQSVVGVQNPSGSITSLTDTDIENCKQYNFKYVLPLNLDANSQLEEVKIEELDEVAIIDKLGKGEDVDVEVEEDVEEDVEEEEDEVEMED